MSGHLARLVIEQLVCRDLSVACAESLTGGLVSAALTDVPGSSAVVRGGVVAYTTAAKAAVLGVPCELLSERGAVDPDVAAEMAAGVAQLFEATVGVATTGVAGPASQDDKEPGTVHIAVWTPTGSFTRSLHLDGDRWQVRASTVDAALELLLGALTE